MLKYNITKAKFIKQLPVDNCLIDTWRITYSTWDYTPEIHVSVFDIAHGGKLSGKYNDHMANYWNKQKTYFKWV